MELKFLDSIGKSVEIEGSNRTFMELKYEIRGFGGIEICGSNRTFMELKSS